MTSAIDLDFIRDAADKKYAAFEVDLGEEGSVSLTNPLRMTKEQRDKLTELEAKEFDDVVDYFTAAWELASSKAEAARLRKALGEEPAIHATLFELYTKGVELGEASPSQD